LLIQPGVVPPGEPGFRRLNLGSRILGQGEVLQQVTEFLQRSFCGIRLPNRRLASMLFLGPTGAESSARSPGVSFSFDRTLAFLYLIKQDDSGAFGPVVVTSQNPFHRLILDLLLQILSAIFQ
jgi:hypothetical protein